jgi:hypothetical protein
MANELQGDLEAFSAKIGETKRPNESWEVG